MNASQYRIELLYRNGTVRTFLRGISLASAESIRWELFRTAPDRDYFVVLDGPRGLPLSANPETRLELS